MVYADSDTSQLLLKTENAIPERARYLGAIVERRSSTMAQKIESFDLLQKNFKETWKDDLNAIETVAPTDNTKAIFYKAAQILPLRDYITFLTLTCRQVEAGKISKQQLKWALFPFEKHLREMWTENPPSAELKELALRASFVLKDDKGMKDFLEKVISRQEKMDNAGENEAALPANPTADQDSPAKPQTKSEPPSNSFHKVTTIKHDGNSKASDDQSGKKNFSQNWRIWSISIFGVFIASLLVWLWKKKVANL
jgi:hypothetical protein